MKHILLLPNREKDPEYRVTLKAAEILYKGGACLYAEDAHTALFTQFGIRPLSLKNEKAPLDFGIVFGGDGSILDASALALRLNMPLLGVNMGRLGYLADLETSQLPLLNKLLNDEYRVRALHVFSVRIGENRLRRKAVNEVTVSRGNRFRIADMELSVDGGSMSYRADGLILATPTGSTAYSLSAGGAVIDPSLDLLTVTPICPHSFFSRSLIFSGETTVSVKNTNEKNERLWVTVDGREGHPLPAGEALTVIKSRKRLKIIQLTDRPFIRVLQEKMSLV